MAKLILIRHGESEYNVKGLWTGLTDVSLTDRGKEETRHAAESIKQVHIDAAFTSALKRAKETLTEIQTVLSDKAFTVTEDAALNERNYGTFTGMDKWKIREQVGEEEFLKIRRSFDYPLKDGESLKDVYNRVVPYYEKAILPQLKEGKNVLIAAHGNSLRALVKYLENIADDQIALVEMVTGEVYVYEITPEGKVSSKEMRGYPQAMFDNAQKQVTFFDDGKLNAAYNAVDKHIEHGNGNKMALLYEADDGKQSQYTFFDLAKHSNRYANYLTGLGVQKGDRVFLFLPRIPELFISFLGILKTGAIAGTMFSAFQEAALKDRLENSEASTVLTTKELLPRIEKVKAELPNLKNIIVVDDEKFQADILLQSENFSIVHTEPEDYAFMLYTSGTTGKPKGIVHAHAAIVQQQLSAQKVLDLRPSDVYWCTADPGWVTGIVYSILSNWSLGVTTFVHGGRFDPDTWYGLLEKYKITVWYTAPTAVRMLMAKGEELVKKHDLSHLRYLASVGEPLNPEAVLWAEKIFGMTFHDTWWQTETGSIMIANTPGFKIKPGSMGKPVPWMVAAVLDDDMNPVPTGQEGNLCLKPSWPSIMRTVWQNKEKYDTYFKNGWYISGDKARIDEDGYFWFIGRADDVIKTSGERVGPFEVESALVEHHSVVEAGVIGKPDEVRGEIIKAFVVLKPGVEATDALKEELAEHVKKHLAGHAYPKEIEFIDKLPKTRSGKIMRRILKAKELGLPIGDTSTLEDY
jgi:acetyl-CoA synthetase